MTLQAPTNAEVLRQQAFEAMELRALKARRRGKVRLLLEVNASGMASLLDSDDDRQLFRYTEYDSEAELLSTFDRVALALGR